MNQQTIKLHLIKLYQSMEDSFNLKKTKKQNEKFVVKLRLITQKIPETVFRFNPNKHKHFGEQLTLGN